jgi:hypothetical protein
MICRAGTYSEAFVSEFEVFLDELKEFFNAMEIDKLLEALCASLESSHYEHSASIKDMVTTFLQCKEKAWDKPLQCIIELSKLREALVELKKVPITKDASTFGYAWNADFQLEDYLFVVVGQFLNSSPKTLIVCINAK